MSEATIQVRLTPRSGRNEIIRFESGILHVRVTSPPVDGAANAALVSLLAQTLSVPKSAISIDSGASSRQKKLTVDGKSRSDIDAILARWQSESAE